MCALRSFKDILLWRPVSMVSLWDDNLSCEITFLYLGVSSMSRYVDLSIVVVICLYKRMDVHVLRPIGQCVIYISRNRCLSIGINMVSFTDSGKYQTSLKPMLCNIYLTCFAHLVCCSWSLPIILISCNISV